MQSKSVEMACKRDWVNFSVVLIGTVDTTDAIGTKRLVLNEVGAFVYRTLDGNQHHAVREVMREGGVGLAIGPGTLKPPASCVTQAQTETIERLASTHENGRRNRFALTVTGTQERRKVVLPGMMNTTLWLNTKTLLRRRRQRLHRNKL